MGLSIASDPAGWRIAGLTPGGPAETAGLAVNDLLDQIEGRPAREWTRAALRELVDTHDTVALHTTATAGPRNLVLPVWTLVP